MSDISYETRLKAETIIDMRDSYLKSMLDIMKIHGDDPTGIAMISASVVMFIEELNKHLHPNFSLMIAEQLLSSQQKKSVQ
jgi:hypothetical protein